MTANPNMMQTFATVAKGASESRFLIQQKITISGIKITIQTWVLRSAPQAVKTFTGAIDHNWQNI